MRQLNDLLFIIILRFVASQDISGCHCKVVCFYFPSSQPAGWSCHVAAHQPGALFSSLSLGSGVGFDDSLLPLVRVWIGAAPHVACAELTAVLFATASLRSLCREAYRNTVYSLHPQCEVCERASECVFVRRQMKLHADKCSLANVFVSFALDLHKQIYHF